MARLLTAMLALLGAGSAFGACIPSGTVDQFHPFIAVDPADKTTRVTGLTGFTVYRFRDAGAAAAMTTPTVQEPDAVNMPGVYRLLLDEDMTVAAGNDVEIMAFHVTQASMEPVTFAIELCRPKVTAGETLTVASGGATVATNNDKTGYALTQTFPTNFADLSITATTGRVDVAAVGGAAQTATNIGARLTGIEGPTFDSGADCLECVHDRGDAAWTTGAGTGLTPLASGTAQGGTVTTIQLAAGETFADDILGGAAVKLTGGTGAGQHAIILSYLGATDTATVHTQYANNQWITIPSTDTTYEIVPATVNVQAWNASGVNTNVQTAADIRTEMDNNSTQLAKLGTPAGASLAADIAALNDLDSTAVQAAANAALVANDLDHLLLTSYDPTTPPGASTSLLNQIIENDLGVVRFTANSLEQAPAGGGGSADWTTGERDEIRGRLGITGTTAVGGNTPTLARQSSIDALNDPSAVAIRDAIMDYVLDNSVTFEQAICHMQAVLLGAADFTTGAPDRTVFQNPGGTQPRVTITYGTDDGDRTSVVLSTIGCGS